MPTITIGEQKANMPTLPSLFALPEKSPLVGIARLASEGESLREGHNVEYFTLPAKSLLNRCVSDRTLPFTWTINPYRGCEFACKYCYARYTHEFMEMRDGAEFEQKIYVKQHTADLLRRELRRVKPGEAIALGTATDPYQPAERRYEVTRSILEEFARHRGFELGIVTKSNLIVRDIDLLRAIAQNNALSIHITVTTLERRTGADSRAARSSPRFADRCCSQLSARGADCGRELLARSARHHRFARRSGGRGARRRRSRSPPHLRRTVVPEALFGSDFPSLP